MREIMTRSLVGKILVAFALLAGAMLLPSVLSNASLLLVSQVLVYAVAIAGFNVLYYAGLLSLAHPFFMGTGGIAYVVFAGEPTSTLVGFGLPPAIALVLAVLISGVLGLLFSPITARVSGLSLAAASLSLVFIGAYVFPRAASLTGGSGGRRVEPFRLGEWFVMDSPGSRWVLTFIIAALSLTYASKLIRSRVGLGLHAIRDGDLFARAVGVNVGRYKAQAFFVSSMYAGLSGALLGMVFGVFVPEPFGFSLALEVLLIAILGGATFVVSGALAGALVFVFLPELLDHYATWLPFVSEQLGTGGIGPTEAARYVFGAAVVAVIIGEPDGLVALVRRVRTRWSNRSQQAEPTASRRLDATGDIRQQHQHEMSPSHSRATQHHP